MKHLGDVKRFSNKTLAGAVFVLALGSVSSLSAQEQSWSYTYNDLGLLATEDGPRTDVEDITTYTYDERGNIATVTNPLAQVTTYNEYDAAGRALSVTDANGVTTEFAYHPRGWLTQTTLVNPDGDNLVTQYEYYADGELKKITRPDGSTLEFEYNGANHLTGMVNQLGERIDYELDPAGNQTQQTITDAEGEIVAVFKSAYDELSRVMDIIGNDGQNEHIDYDANDNPTASTNAREAQTTTQYDALNRVSKIIDAEAGETTFSYDAQDNLKTVTDARGNTTTYDYDGLGNLLSLTSPDTGTTTYLYDDAGNRIQQTDARGVVVNYAYDALNRLTKVTHPSDDKLDITYTYDEGDSAIGRVSEITDNSGSIAYQYDYLGRITAQINTRSGFESTVRYTYQGDKLSTITYPSGRIVQYSYDGEGRISDVSTKASASATAQALMSEITYAPYGPALSWEVGNGLQLNQSYDLDYRLTQIQLSASDALMHRIYDYDLANNIKQIDDQLDETKTQDLTYDLVNRLVFADGSYGSITYEYDAVGNRTKRTVGDAISGTEAYEYADDSNWLKSVVIGDPESPSGTKIFEYDEAGNTIEKTENLSDTATTVYTYSAENRLDAVLEDNKLLGAYTYNALGQRTKVDYLSSQESFIYGQSGELLAVLDIRGNAKREYLYAGGQKAAVVVHDAESTELYYIHNDHLGTPQMLTDQDQSVVWSVEYTPFGIVTKGNVNFEKSRFPGQYFDVATGTSYNYFRDYDPELGRYIQSDPIGLEGGINTYAYVGGNPLSFIDPLGLIAWTGSGNVKSAGKYVILGYQWGVFDLVSECVDGRRARVKIKASGFPIGVGSPSEDVIDISMYDYEDSIKPEIFNGDFSYSSGGVNAFGSDVSGASLVLGGAYSDSINTTGGIGLGAGATMTGSSKVISVQWQDCQCEGQGNSTPPPDPLTPNCTFELWKAGLCGSD